MIQLAAEQEAELSQLRSNYVLDDPTAVVAFLAAHECLPGLLLEAVAPLKRSFGVGSVVHLQLRTDGDSPILYAVVPWTGSLSEAKKSLQAFDNHWWLDNSGKALGNVVFDYELA